MTGDVNPRTPRTLQTIRKAVFHSPLMELPYFEIEVDGKCIRYSAPENGPMVLARVQTLFAKEPTTIPYLEMIQPSETLLDIGANIGMYTIYAAVMTGCRVVAVEPEALNFAELNKSIYLNGLNDRVLALCVAASDEDRIAPLQLGAFGVSYSHHDFGESSWRKDMKWSETFTVDKDKRLTQGSTSISIDAIVESGLMPFPDHIKIDVDGLEHRVIAGAERTLADPRLKTVLIEIDFSIDTARAIVTQMTAAGWKYSMSQLRTNRAAVLDESTISKLWSQKRDGFNYIFFRDEAVGKVFERFLAGYAPPYDGARLKHVPKLQDFTLRHELTRFMKALGRKSGAGPALRAVLRR